MFMSKTKVIYCLIVSDYFSRNDLDIECLDSIVLIEKRFRIRPVPRLRSFFFFFSFAFSPSFFFFFFKTILIVELF